MGLKNASGSAPASGLDDSLLGVEMLQHLSGEGEMMAWEDRGRSLVARWKRFDQACMKRWFGGKSRDRVYRSTAQAEQDMLANEQALGSSNAAAAAPAHLADRAAPPAEGYGSSGSSASPRNGRRNKHPLSTTAATDKDKDKDRSGNGAGPSRHGHSSSSSSGSSRHGHGHGYGSHSDTPNMMTTPSEGIHVASSMPHLALSPLDDTKMSLPRSLPR